MELDINYEKQIRKTYGDVLVDASFIIDTPKKLISVSPSLDIALKGGLLEGTFVQFSGQRKCGKTTLALQVGKNAQKMDKLVLYANIEARLKKLNLDGIKGLDLNKLKVLTSVAGHILTAEEYLNVIVNFVKLHSGCIVIMDSLSALCSGDEITSDIEQNRRPGVPRLLAQFFRQLAPIVPLQNAVIIAIQHLMQTQGRFVSGKIETGGDYIGYQSDCRLRAKYTEDWKVGDKQIGHKINWELAWSATGPPVDNVVSYLKYGEGISELTELFFLAADFGLISKSGAWFECSFLEQHKDDKIVKKFLEGENKIKFQGQENCCEFLAQNQHFIDLLYEDVRKMSL